MLPMVSTWFPVNFRLQCGFATSFKRCLPLPWPAVVRMIWNVLRAERWWELLGDDQCGAEKKPKKHIIEGFQKWGYPKIEGLKQKIRLKWMLLGYPHFGKPPCILSTSWHCNWDILGWSIIIRLGGNRCMINILVRFPTYWGLSQLWQSMTQPVGMEGLSTAQLRCKLL